MEGRARADRRLAPVAVALDAPDIDVAAHWATLVTPYVSTVKIGLSCTCGTARRGGDGARRERVHVFLDLKLHDIPTPWRAPPAPSPSCAGRSSPSTPRAART